MTAEFACMGFAPQEMIQVVAGGQTLGGVHSAKHPTMVLPNTTALGVADFDSTNSTYDNKVVTGWLSRRYNPEPLVIGPDVESRSDLQIFSSDGNKTVSSMADPASYLTTCSTILAKMIDTVPAHDVNPYNLQLNVVGDDDMQFSGAIWFKTTSVPKSAISSIQLACKDRNGADGVVIGTTILGDASGFDDTFSMSIEPDINQYSTREWLQKLLCRRSDL
ncbi:hypothetical protein A1O3_06085 [Capronia epimyces CBS 606.96]|uniref:Peroxidase n=1 Tax=Capronia epimyces CBS 606.96 TaxID=1182542 RepID=W9XNZ7_9EURO|nr:uncharacterized protein A1O3_06085 [Capronia epimyces CBS 606.96]EXJ82272.1 hypothetical protein A1O3_06085 [Capronia epimyces CBS 606.96]